MMPQSYRNFLYRVVAIQGKCGSIFSCISSFQLIYDIYYRSAILYDPKGIDSCKRSTFILEC